MTIQGDYNKHWRGPFDSWQEALEEASHGESAWANQDWIRRQLTFLESGSHPRHNPPRPSFLPIVAGMMNVSKIVDYGGGSGWAFALVNESCPDLRINSYSVLELPSVIKELGKFANLDSRITFLPFEDVELIPEADLLYSNASLHYGQTEQSFFDAARGASRIYERVGVAGASPTLSA